MAQGGSIKNVKYDTGTGKFFIADNDDIPNGNIVQGKVDPVTGGNTISAGTSTVKLPAGEVDLSAPIGGSLRFAATRCQFANTDNSVNKQTMNRSRHYLRADCSSIRLVYANCRADDYSNGEIALGTATIKASIELSNGTIVPVTFSGAASVDVAALGVSVSDEIKAGLVKGDYFYVRTFYSCSGGILYISKTPSTVHGEGMEFGITTTDKTGGGSITAGGPGIYTPAAIIGIHSGDAVACIGDSRMFGADDAYTGSLFNDIGHTRAIGQAVAYSNFGIPASAAYKAKTQYAVRAQIINAYSTVVVGNFGINDINVYSRTPAQTLADIQTIQGLLSKPMYQMTLEPNTTSTDSWATTTNQTPVAGNANRVAFNKLVRESVCFSGVIEAADASESARDSGLWKPGYTADGLHGNQKSYAAFAAFGSLRPGMFS